MKWNFQLAAIVFSLISLSAFSQSLDHSTPQDGEPTRTDELDDSAPELDDPVATLGGSENDTIDQDPPVDVEAIIEALFDAERLPSVGDLPGAEQFANKRRNETKLPVDLGGGAGVIPPPEWGPELREFLDVDKKLSYNILKPPPFSEFPYVVRCPNGWTAAGPYCTAVLRASPYTECIDQKKRLKDGNKVINTPLAVSICSRTLEQGALVRCPPGYSFFAPDAPLPEEVFSPLLEKELRLPETEEQVMCVGFSVESKAVLDPLEPCEQGYGRAEEGCAAVVKVPPEISCPEGWSLTFTPINPYAFKGKQYAYCSKDVLTKGRFWCPPGFYPYAEPYPELPLGAPIPPGTNVTYSDVSRGYGFLVPPGVPQSSCIQIAAVPSDDCDELQCYSEALSEAKDALKKWTYYVLESDPFVGVKQGIPSGKDWRLTTSHLRTEY